MEYLKLEELSKSYGDKILLNNISLTISEGDKVALIAKNGSGKTTLLKIIAGIESGEGQDHKNLLNQSIRVGFLTQNPQFDPQLSIMEVLLGSKDDRIQALYKYKTAQHINSETELHRATQVMDDLQAWDLEAKIHELLAQLNLKDTEQLIGELSGGQVKRLALARIILEDYDFLILDEPTNHLDLEMIEWLEEYLKRSSLTLFMVTHDRYFLERICNNMLELDRGRIQKFKGNYSEYLLKKEMMEETNAANLDKSKKLLRKELEWMRKQPKARTTKAKSRISDFNHLEDKVKSETIHDKEMQFYLPGRRLGKKIVEFRTTSFAYGDKKILNKFDYKFASHEKVGIVGPNGAGKTTMIKLLTGEIKPDMGRVEKGDTVHFGHYRQDGIVIDKDKKVIDVIRDIAEYLPLENGKELGAAQLLERFMFPRKQQEIFAYQLSGGELKRLQLLAVLMENPNFLILDEPTNDLDILTLNVLETFLKDFPGCLVIISHDRYFLDKLVDHLFVLDGNGNVKDYNGGYTRYRAEYGKGFDHHFKEVAGSSIEEGSKTTDNKKDYELRKKIRKVEKEIEKYEKRKVEINEKLFNPDFNQDDLIRLSKELKTIDEKIEEKEMIWMEVTEKLE